MNGKRTWESAAARSETPEAPLSRLIARAFADSFRPSKVRSVQKSRENVMGMARAFVYVAAGLVVVPIGACASRDAGRSMTMTQSTAPPHMAFEVRGVV